MTHRQDLERHRHSLQEIREIMYSMKTLAYMETRKLDRFIVAQQAVVRNIEAVADDFLAFHREFMPAPEPRAEVCIVIGSERGFCGDFNQSLVRELETYLESHPHSNVETIAIGRKLHPLLENHEPRVHYLDGPGVVEEVASVLNRLVEQLNTLQEAHGLLSVFGIYHDSSAEILRPRLLPPFQDLPQDRDTDSQAPLLQLSAREFLIELTDHYLFAALNRMLYASLMAENHNRVSHLEGAVRHLDDESDNLSRRCNTLRQEEIIEEIEVILLSTDSLTGTDG
ncbi:MAG: FoF1 ATP synthase subunit gamma [Gammaproteobacteria bacterium]|nr:F0F1 ATP synthase subunit gamma [Pseudomonadales bacterium]MCP5348048.1 F0F1 ATP synthase subunit gamma [Pseudomonadales bacterium]